jgi:hypothetical protein
MAWPRPVAGTGEASTILMSVGTQSCAVVAVAKDTLGSSKIGYVLFPVASSAVRLGPTWMSR